MTDADDAKDRKSTRDRELDDFWDISRLLPHDPADRQRKTTPARCLRDSPEAVEIELAPREPDGKSTAAAHDEPLPKKNGAGSGSGLLGQAHYVPPHTADEGKTEAPELSYEAESVLLHRVEVYTWKSDYRYFDQFARDAAAYTVRRAPSEPPPRESFFSFFPQYAQMGSRQEAWYLWWREQVRHGVFPDTDYAYILLYIFELINSPLPSAADDRGEAGRICRSMAQIWMAYRRRCPQLDHYMCEWLCDFCLIHRLNAPSDILSPALDDITRISEMKEFYLSAAVGGQDSDTQALTGARILLRYCCQYDYRRSKFAVGENAALYDRIIPGAIAAMLPSLLGQEGKPPLVSMQDSKVTRDAYTGALCAYQNKRRLVVAYTSFSRSHDLRFLIGDMVKHTENRLRKHIGVRSRLSVINLPTAVRNALDAYLDPLLPAPSASLRSKQEPPRPAYEALYDMPRNPVSQEEASRIEQSSWETTRILTEAFGDGEDGREKSDDAQAAAPAARAGAERHSENDPAGSAAAKPDPFCSAPELSEFLRLAYDGDGKGQRALAARLHVLPDGLADRINEWSAEGNIGDIILEETDGVYTVIDEYRETVSVFLRKEGSSNEQCEF